MTATDGAGIRTFQLRLLSMFRGNDSLVEKALTALDADHSEMDSIAVEYEQILRPSVWFEQVPALLGPPDSLHTEQSKGSQPVTLTRCTYSRLPLWPDLEFFYLASPDLPIAHNAGFARVAHAPRAALSGLADLVPWSCLRDEVVERFGPAVEEGALWPPYESYRFRIVEADGAVEHRWMVFSFGLLQIVDND
ncbi:hypothetical protein [Nocardia sp. XZ_19_385]|uniref:hypothetical protein n=1 Tax=Nocardia sp. XZ_19_385 TaxID=2769488 RepID=UPI00188E1760|nr:hypothetical protein [Nocardia sp. XZ_19_385]